MVIMSRGIPKNRPRQVGGDDADETDGSGVVAQLPKVDVPRRSSSCPECITLNSRTFSEVHSRPACVSGSWLAILGTLTVGVSCGLPLYLYLEARQAKTKSLGTSPFGGGKEGMTSVEAL